MPRTTLRSTIPVKDTLPSDHDKHKLEVQDDRSEDEEIERSKDNGQKTRAPSPYMHSFKPEMWTDPHPLDFADGLNSRDFVLEKMSRQVLKSLQPKNLEEWLEIAEEAWNWFESEEARRKQVLLEKVLSSEVEGNSQLIDYLEERIQDLREQLQSAA